MKQLKLIVLIYLAVLLVSGCMAAKEENGSDSAVGVNNIRQIITSDNAHSRMLMWSAVSGQKYTVEYKKQGENSRQLQAQEISFTDSGYQYQQYKALIEGLEPGSIYEYRIRKDKEIGAWHKLHTDDGGNITAVVFPDSQSTDYSGWGKLAASAVKNNPQADLYINLGDLVDNGQDGRQWQDWLQSVGGFSSELPLVPVIGNHETYTLDWKLRYPATYIKLFSVPDNGSEAYKGQFYSFDYGDVHFTVLDTNFQEMQATQPELLADELRWLENDLAAAKARWKVVLMHKDIMLYGFNNRPGTVEHFTDAGEALMPIFDKYQPDVVLSAHLHTYRRRQPLKNFVPDSKGVVYILSGVAGSVRYADLWKDSQLDAAHAPRPETENYLTLQSSDEELVIKAFLQDGTCFDEVKITKNK